MTDYPNHEIKFRDDQKPSFVPFLSVDDAVALAKSVDLPEQLLDVSLYRHLTNSPHAALMVEYIKQYVNVKSDLDPVIREMAILRGAWNVGCEYVWVHHIAPMRISTLTLPEESRLKARLDPSDPSLTKLESLVLTLTDEICLNQAGSPETTQALKELLPSDANLVDLVFATCYYVALEKMAKTLAFPIEDHYSVWFPDGIVPPNRYGH